MKEYVLVPINDFNRLQTSADVSIQQTLPKDLPPDTTLGLIQTLKQREAIPRAPEVIKPINNGYSNFLPLQLRAHGDKIIELFSRLDTVNIDDNGIMGLTELNTSVRIEDVLKGFLIKNSSIKPIEDIMSYLAKFIPNEYILNSKVSKLQSSIDKTPKRPKYTIRMKRKTPLRKLYDKSVKKNDSGTDYEDANETIYSIKKDKKFSPKDNWINY